MLKDKIIGTIEIMSEKDLQLVWTYITHNLTTTHKTIKDLSAEDVKKYLDSIPAIEPDEVDLKMLAELKNNPDCSNFGE